MNEPGRNDPCPCGSGKKYKKCCGVPKQKKVFQATQLTSTSHNNFFKRQISQISNQNKEKQEKLKEKTEAPQETLPPSPPHEENQ